MSRHGSTPAGTHPLSQRSSAARRRIVLSQQSPLVSEATEEAVRIKTPSRQTESLDETVVAGTPPKCTSTPETDDDLSCAICGSAEAWLTIRKMLQQPEALSWVFAGESLNSPQRPTEGGRTYVEVFGDAVRCSLQRRFDAVIETAYSRARVHEINEHFDWLVVRHQPSIVSLLVGWADATHDEDSVARFTQQARGLIDRVREIGAIPVLQTPPPFMSSRNPESDSLRNRIAAIRSIADVDDVPLVDHARRWKRLAISGLEWKRWVHASTALPNGEGHQLFAEVLFAACGLPL